MTNPGTDLLIDALGRVRETVHEAVEGLDRDRLAVRVDGSSNSIAWLVWHLSRIQDDHIAEVAGSAGDGPVPQEQVWHAQGWVDRFALPLDRDDHGFGHDDAQVAAVVADAELLTGYADVVHQRTVGYLRDLPEDELPRVVDDSYDPPVTLAVRLVSVLDDCAQHAGQAAFLRGVLDRRG